MNRKITAILMALSFVLTLFPITAMAASVPAKTEVPEITVLEERTPTDAEPLLYCEYSVPQSVMDIVIAEDVSVGICYDMKIDNGPWIYGEAPDLAYYLTQYEAIEGTTNKYFINLLPQNDAVDGTFDIKAHKYTVKLYFLYNDNFIFTSSNFSAEKSIGGLAFQSSSWATPAMQKAADMGLIPDILRTADLTKPITRKEFAAVCVKAYENLSGEQTTPAAKNPFKDTSDTEVLKAYNFGLMIGVSADKFDPDAVLNREQAATALTNVLKRAYLPQDGKTYTLNFVQPKPFSDDAKISDWAKPSVYFMVANGVITGMPNNIFAPRNTTTAETAIHYADATREQALVIAVKMVENLKEKPLDYK